MIEQIPPPPDANGEQSPTDANSKLPPSEQQLAAPNESDQPVSVDRIAQLRNLLAQRPASGEDKDWLLQVERLYNQLAVQYLKEPEDDRAFAILALVSLGNKKGIKAAKEASVTASRWKATAPPKLGILATDEEKRAALVAISKVRAAWLPEYLLVEGLTSTNSSEVKKDATAAYAKTSQALVVYLDATTNVIVNTTGFNSPLDAIKIGIESIKPGERYFGKGLIASLSTLVATVQSANQAAEESESNRSTMRDKLMQLVDTLTAHEPNILLDPKFLRATESIRHLASGKSKVVEKTLAQSARRLGAIASHLKNSGLLAQRSAIQDFLKTADDILPVHAVAEKAGLDLGNDPSESGTAVSESSIQEQLAGILPALYRAQLPGAALPALEELTEQMAHLCKTQGVNYLGTVDDQVEFDPFSHVYEGEGEETPIIVKITVPGVRITRIDGTQKIYLRAITEKL